jgi:signal transduction histidine kinase
MNPRKIRLGLRAHNNQTPDQGRSGNLSSTSTSSTTQARPSSTGPPTPPHFSVQRLLRDPLVLSACVVCALLISYQVIVTRYYPPWIGPVTDWLRSALAWPELLIVVLVSRRLSRIHHPAARSWWMWSAALLSYAVARTLWSVYDQVIYHQGVPFPTFPDLFFILQYPFFFLAVILLPHAPSWESRLIRTLDGVLVMGAATSLSWHFILAPIYSASGISPLARSVSLAYPFGDLFVLFGLTMTLLRPSRYRAVRLVLEVLVLAVICLVLADSWVDWLLLSPPHVYRTGHAPDEFWFAFYLLVPLAAVIQIRLAKYEPQWGGATEVKDVESVTLRWHDFRDSLRLFFPIIAALVASVLIMIDATKMTMEVGWQREIAPFIVCACLIFLIFVRQELIFLDNSRLRRMAEIARANELAMREIARAKDEFLGIASHELKTPLSSLQGYIELIARRFNAMRPTEAGADQIARDVALARTAIQYAEGSLSRINRLVDDILDDTRIRSGRMHFRLEPSDLGVVVGQAVKEQQVLAPERTIHFTAPAAPVPVMADASRIGQVVANYLSNALKYSREDQPVEVRLEVQGDVARVSVRDEGIGVPASEQARVWERFQRIEGNTVQSGSGVSLGIGLHISKNIIEGHDGAVGMESIPGQGSTFWFTLPLTGPVDQAGQQGLDSARENGGE